MFTDIRAKIPAFGESVQVKKNGIFPRLNAAENIYNGPPTAQDLALITALTNRPSEVDDWEIWSFLAADNTLHMDFQAYSPSMLEHYSKEIAGHAVILDHAWNEIGKAKGLIFDAALYRTDTLPDEARSHVPNMTASSALTEAEGGYYWVLVKAAFRAGTPAAEGLADGTINRCSIGAKIYDAFAYCPNCSTDKGRYVGFWEEEEVEFSDGKNARLEIRHVCPHTPLNDFNLWLYSSFGEDRTGSA